MMVLTARGLAAGGLDSLLFRLAAAGQPVWGRGPQAANLSHPTAEQKNNIASISAVVTQNPRDANALNLRGTAYGQSGDYEKAIMDFTTAIQVNPQFYQAYNNRALINLRAGHLEAAMADYNQAIAIKPTTPPLMSAGAMFTRTTQFSMAIADFGRAIELKADDPAAYYARGLIYQAMNDHRSGARRSERRGQLPARRANPAFRPGRQLPGGPDHKKALEDFQVAGTNKVNHHEAWAYAGQAAEAMGDRKGSGEGLSQGAADQ